MYTRIYIYDIYKYKFVRYRVKKKGVSDVEDVVAGATYLVKRGSVDEKRLCIDGRSAGGLTTLGALAFKDVFTAGCSM
jgi:dipeptidyl aminopeptidase/acylaminoacyl peptidase